MTKTIYPTIFFSISNSGIELIESIQKDVKRVNSNNFSRFIRYAAFHDEGTITNSISDEIISFSFPASKDKAVNYAKVHQNRQNYKAIFEKLINDIYIFENTNYAAENDLTLDKPQIIVLSSIDTPELSPLVIPLLQILDTLPQNPDIHLIILYNQKLHTEIKEEIAILKNSFFRELDSMKSNHPPHVWLIDIVNEREINLKDSQTLFFAIGQFTDLLVTDSGQITRSTYSGTEFNKPCIYSTFGYSLLTFPADKIKEYLGLYACSKEISYLADSFISKYEVISLKDELNKFIISSGIEGIPEKIIKKDNAEPIYGGFIFNERKFFDIENVAILSKKLSPVEEPLTFSQTNSNDFFHMIDEYEKLFLNTTYLEFSQSLDKSKKRELLTAEAKILAAMGLFMDDKDKGVNYSHLFVAMLANNKGAVENMLEGRFTSDIPTLNNLQDKFRSCFIGDQLIESEKTLREESDNYANKLKLINQYANQIINAEQSLKRIEESVGADNPKYTELNTQISSLKDQINLFTSDIELHKKNIADVTYMIEQVKLEFDRDATKESYKKGRNEKHNENLAKIRDEKINDLDKELASKYEEKNKRITERNKFIFYNLIIFPVAIFLVLLVTQVILVYKTEWFTVKWFYRGLILTFLTVLVYYIINFVKFFKFKKRFRELLEKIQFLLSDKKNLFGRYVILKNNCYQNEFLFERDLIALSMIDSLMKSTTSLQSDIDDFKSVVRHENIRSDELKGSFSFPDSSFEFCVIGRSEIEEIYDSSAHGRIINKDNKVSLSKCFEDFVRTRNLNSIFKPILEEASEVYERKVQGETLKSILFNESSTFKKNVNARAKFQQVIETSRPLLKTGFWPNLSPDTAYTENIIIGQNHSIYKQYIKDNKFSSLSIEESNQYLFGILSIKSNFPSFLIYDVEANENIMRKAITKDNRSKYFINENSFNYSLIPAINKVDKDEKGNILMGNELIFSLTRGIISFDPDKKKFTHSIIGDLGFELADLINNWTTPVCYEIIEEARKEYEEIWHADENEFRDYSAEFKKVWMDFPVIISQKFENELSEYFFSIKGTEPDWNEIKKSFKSKRKKP